MRIVGKDVLPPEVARQKPAPERLDRGAFQAALAGPPGRQALGDKLAIWTERAANRPPCPECGPVYEERVIAGAPLRLRVQCPHEAADDARILRDEAARAAANERFTKLLERIGKFKLPSAYAGVMLADLDDDPRSLEGKQTVAYYLETLSERLAAGHGIMALGDVGTGKSLALAALVNELEARRVAAMFVTAGDLQSRLTDFSKTETGASRAEVFFELAREVDVLVLDDLGTEARITNYQVGELFRLVNARSQDDRPTCFTSNLAVDERIDGLSSLAEHFTRGLMASRGPGDPETHRMSAEDAGKRVERILSRFEALNVAVPFLGADRRKEKRPTWHKAIRS